MRTAEDLIAPAGMIGEYLFPGEDDVKLAERIEAYLTDGYTRGGAAGLGGAELDSAAEAWAYHRAFKEVHLRLSATPSTINLQGELNTSYTKAQIDSFGELASTYFAVFDGLVNDVPVPTRRYPNASTVAVKTQVGW